MLWKLDYFQQPCLSLLVSINIKLPCSETSKTWNWVVTRECLQDDTKYIQNSHELSLPGFSPAASSIVGCQSIACHNLKQQKDRLVKQYTSSFCKEKICSNIHALHLNLLSCHFYFKKSLFRLIQNLHFFCEVYSFQLIKLIISIFKCLHFNLLKIFISILKCPHSKL